MPPSPPKIQTYKQAVVFLEDIKIFLEHHGHLELASNATSLLSELSTCHSDPKPNNTSPVLSLTLCYDCIIEIYIVKVNRGVDSISPQ